MRRRRSVVAAALGLAVVGGGIGVLVSTSESGAGPELSCPFPHVYDHVRRVPDARPFASAADAAAWMHRTVLGMPEAEIEPTSDPTLFALVEENNSTEALLRTVEVPDGWMPSDYEACDYPEPDPPNDLPPSNVDDSQLDPERPIDPPPTNGDETEGAE